MAIDFSKSGWAGDLNDFIEANSISDTGWTDEGVTMLNGFEVNASDPLKYRIVTFGATKMLFLTGFISGPAMTENEKLNVAQFPTALTDFTSGVQIGGTNTKSAIGLFQLNSDCTLDWVLYGASLTAGDGTWLNMLCSSN